MLSDGVLKDKSLVSRLPRTDFKLLGLALISSASPWQVSKAIKAYNYEYIVNFGVNE